MLTRVFELGLPSPEVPMEDRDINTLWLARHLLGVSLASLFRNIGIKCSKTSIKPRD